MTDDKNLRRLLEDGLDGAAYDELESASRERTLRELNEIRTRSASQRARRQRLTFVIAAAVLTAIAISGAIALAPDPAPNKTGTEDPTPGLTATASAAEALAWAGDVVVAEGSGDSGSGPVWHGSSRTYHDGTLSTVNEQWFDTTSEQNLLLAWGRSTRDDDVHDVLLIDRVDADGVHRLREFERPGPEDSWDFPKNGDLNPTRAMDIPHGRGDRQGQLADAMRAWLAEVTDGASQAELARATSAFLRSTPDYFSADPEWAHDSFGENGQPSDEQMQEYERVRAAVPNRQVLYLLTTVQATPQATAELYRTIGGFEKLDRLSNVKIDGRTVIRVRFDPSSPEMNPYRERVLVIDAGTGRPVRTETLDRSAWTELEPAKRVAKVGDGSVLCADGSPDDCELVDNAGPAAQLGDRFSLDMQVRYASYRINRAEHRRTGDPDVLCAKWDGRGKCVPQSPAEAKLLDALYQDQQALLEVATLDAGGPGQNDDNAFSTVKPITDVTNTDGSIRPGSQCARDWRYLSICRG